MRVWLLVCRSDDGSFSYRDVAEIDALEHPAEKLDRHDTLDQQ